MGPTGTGHFTLADFRRLPEVAPPLEFFGGRVIQKPSPRLVRSVIQSELLVALMLHARATGQGCAYLGLRCTFGGASHVFDICVFVADRLPDPTDPADRDDILVPPDLAIEVRSPGQTVGELRGKLRSAVRRGVRLGWLIDEAGRRVDVIRPKVTTQALRPGAELTGGDVLPGFRLPVDEMFGWVGGR